MNLGVVLVTYNRLEKLKIALECYKKQTYLPKKMFIVDNASTDGTKEFLEDWVQNVDTFEVELIFLKNNTGGSGGFYSGLKKSLLDNLDFIWVSDDDAFPDKNAFKMANDYLEKHDSNKISALCGCVMNRGKIDIFHRRRLHKVFPFLIQTFVSKREYKNEEFKFNLFTYVGTFLNTNKMKKAGITIKDYFIYCDDTEHSYRMSLQGDIICLPNIRITHDGPLNNGKDGVTWKLYYGIRNSIDFVHRNFNLVYFSTYVIYFYIKYYLLTTFLWENKKEGYKVINKAIKDGKIGKLGLDNIYKPGWKPRKKGE